MTKHDPQEHPALPNSSRSVVLRDMLVFQAKLFVDGVKDLILSPLSLVAGLIGLAIGRQPGALFYRTLRSGKRLEHWIDLFGAADSTRGDETPASTGRPGQDFDTLVDRLQTSILDPETRARLSADSKNKLDAIIRKMRGSDTAGDGNHDSKSENGNT